jgi:hypothetical protein
MKTTLDFVPVTLAGRDGREITFRGAVLGSGSSKRDEHSHYSGYYARKGEKCSACRWFEVTIYKRTLPTGDATYDFVLHTIGNSIVPNEQRFSRVAETSSAYELVELLTVRPYHGDPFIAAQSQRALAQAASLDDDVRDAYVNRAVV